MHNNKKYKAQRSFGWQIGLALIAFAAMLFLQRRFVGACITSLSGTALVIFALLRPSWLVKPFSVFTVIVSTIGYYNSLVILTMVYIIIILPTAVLIKLSGKDTLNRKLKPDIPSYWNCQKADRFSSFLNQF